MAAENRVVYLVSKYNAHEPIQRIVYFRETQRYWCQPDGTRILKIALLSANFDSFDEAIQFQMKVCHEWLQANARTIEAVRARLGHTCAFQGKSAEEYFGATKCV